MHSKQSTIMFVHALIATIMTSTVVMVSAASSAIIYNVPSEAHRNRISNSNNFWMPSRTQTQTTMQLRNSESTTRSISKQDYESQQSQLQSQTISSLIKRLSSSSCGDGFAFISSSSGSISSKKCYHQQYPIRTALPISTRSTILSMAYTSSSSSSSDRRQGNQNQNQKNRNRGANAANQNRRGHSFRQDSKDGFVRPKKNTKRAPRWEREGDKLYAEVTKQLDAYGDNEDEDGDGTSKHLMALAKSERIISTVQDVCELLEPWTASDEWLADQAARLERRKNQQSATKRDDDTSKSDEDTTPKEEKSDNSKKPPPFLWGTLPVGPVLARRLASSERAAPTSVQRAAFPILTAGLGKGNASKRNKKSNEPIKKSNAIIASPTGTGKTLAYLLPLLCTSPGGQGGEGTGGVLIVTPTIELACQIQREVDVLWPPTNSATGQQSSLFVVGANDNDSLDADEDNDEDNDSLNPGRIILRSMQHAPLIAGTPKMLRMLYREAGRIANGEYDFDDVTFEERATSKSLLRNLRAIVLDEADRLLRTEAVARETTERKARKMQQRRAEEAAEAPVSKKKKQKLVIARETQTELLLRDLPIPSLLDVQIICASATIGRTMRRQLMQILDAPSADAAATLVTGDEDERVKSKDAERRKSVLLPEKLQHAYRVVADTKEEEDGDAVVGQEEGVPTLIMSKSERNEERRVKDTIRALWDTMVSMEDTAKPIIIFPGRVGVERVQSELMARGLEDVRTLRNLDGMTPDVDIDVVGAMPIADNKDDANNKWSSIPVYIIGERFARGLDLPDVEYVFMLSPPSSAAGYAHMAGRTGRVGRVGTAITMVRPKNNEVQRLAAIAEALGLKFAESMSGVASGEKIGHGGVSLDSVAVVEEEEEDGSSDGQDIELNNAQDLNVPEDDSSSFSCRSSYPWELLSEPTLGKKKNAELYEYLVSFGVKTINKRSKKAELVSAIQALHSKK